MSSSEVMEDDPDRWYKMVLEDKEAMSSREQIVEGCKWMTYEVVMPVDPDLGDADPTPGSGSLKVRPLSYALGQIYNIIDQEKLRRQGQATLDGLDEFAEMQEASEKTAGEKADAEKVKRNGDREQMDNCDAGKSEVRLF